MVDGWVDGCHWSYPIVLLFVMVEGWVGVIDPTQLYYYLLWLMGGWMDGCHCSYPIVLLFVMVEGWVGVIDPTQLYYYLLWLRGGWVSLILPNCIIICYGWGVDGCHWSYPIVLLFAMVEGWVGVIDPTQLYYYLLWLRGGWVSLIPPNCIIICYGWWVGGWLSLILPNCIIICYGWGVGGCHWSYPIVLLFVMVEGWVGVIDPTQLYYYLLWLRGGWVSLILPNCIIICYGWWVGGWVSLILPNCIIICYGWWVGGCHWSYPIVLLFVMVDGWVDGCHWSYPIVLLFVMVDGWVGVIVLLFVMVDGWVVVIDPTQLYYYLLWLRGGWVSLILPNCIIICYGWGVGGCHWSYPIVLLFVMVKGWVGGCHWSYPIVLLFVMVDGWVSGCHWFYPIVLLFVMVDGWVGVIDPTQLYYYLLWLMGGWVSLILPNCIIICYGWGMGGCHWSYPIVLLFVMVEGWVGVIDPTQLYYYLLWLMGGWMGVIDPTQLYYYLLWLMGGWVSLILPNCIIICYGWGVGGCHWSYPIVLLFVMVEGWVGVIDPTQLYYYLLWLRGGWVGVIDPTQLYYYLLWLMGGWVGVIDSTQLYYYLLWLMGGWVSLILPNCIIICYGWWVGGCHWSYPIVLLFVMVEGWVGVIDPTQLYYYLLWLRGGWVSLILPNCIIICYGWWVGGCHWSYPIVLLFVMVEGWVGVIDPTQLYYLLWLRGGWVSLILPNCIIICYGWGEGGCHWSYPIVLLFVMVEGWVGVIDPTQLYYYLLWLRGGWVSLILPNCIIICYGWGVVGCHWSYPIVLLFVMVEGRVGVIDPTQLYYYLLWLRGGWVSLILPNCIIICYGWGVGGCQWSYPIVLLFVMVEGWVGVIDPTQLYYYLLWLSGCHWYHPIVLLFVMVEGWAGVIDPTQLYYYLLWLRGGWVSLILPNCIIICYGWAGVIDTTQLYYYLLWLRGGRVSLILPNCIICYGWWVGRWVSLILPNCIIICYGWGVGGCHWSYPIVSLFVMVEGWVGVIDPTQLYYYYLLWLSGCHWYHPIVSLFVMVEGWVGVIDPTQLYYYYLLWLRGGWVSLILPNCIIICYGWGEGGCHWSYPIVLLFVMVDGWVGVIDPTQLYYYLLWLRGGWVSLILPNCIIICYGWGEGGCHWSYPIVLLFVMVERVSLIPPNCIIICYGWGVGGCHWSYPIVLFVMVDGWVDGCHWSYPIVLLFVMVEGWVGVIDPTQLYYYYLLWLSGCHWYHPIVSLFVMVEGWVGVIDPTQLYYYYLLWLRGGWVSLILPNCIIICYGWGEGGCHWSYPIVLLFVMVDGWVGVIDPTQLYYYLLWLRGGWVSLILPNCIIICYGWGEGGCHWSYPIVLLFVMVDGWVGVIDPTQLYWYLLWLRGGWVSLILPNCIIICDGWWVGGCHWSYPIVLIFVMVEGRVGVIDPTQLYYYLLWLRGGCVSLILPNCIIICYGWGVGGCHWSYPIVLLFVMVEGRVGVIDPTQLYYYLLWLRGGWVSLILPNCIIIFYGWGEGGCHWSYPLVLLFVMVEGWVGVIDPTQLYYYLLWLRGGWVSLILPNCIIICYGWGEGGCHWSYPIVLLFVMVEGRVGVIDPTQLYYYYLLWLRGGWVSLILPNCIIICYGWVVGGCHWSYPIVLLFVMVEGWVGVIDPTQLYYYLLWLRGGWVSLILPNCIIICYGWGVGGCHCSYPIVLLFVMVEGWVGVIDPTQLYYYLLWLRGGWVSLILPNCIIICYGWGVGGCHWSYPIVLLFVMVEGWVGVIDPTQLYYHLLWLRGGWVSLILPNCIICYGWGEGGCH